MAPAQKLHHPFWGARSSRGRVASESNITAPSAGLLQGTSTALGTDRLTDRQIDFCLSVSLSVALWEPCRTSLSGAILFGIVASESGAIPEFLWKCPAEEERKRNCARTQIHSERLLNLLNITTAPLFIAGMSRYSLTRCVYPLSVRICILTTTSERTDLYTNYYF
eukprot:gene10127-biopygen1033